MKKIFLHFIFKDSQYKITPDSIQQVGKKLCGGALWMNRNYKNEILELIDHVCQNFEIYLTFVQVIDRYYNGKSMSYLTRLYTKMVASCFRIHQDDQWCYKVPS